MTFNYKLYEKLQFAINCLYIIDDEIKNNLWMLFTVIFIVGSFLAGIISIIYSFQFSYLIFISVTFLITLTFSILLLFLIFNAMYSFMTFSLNILMKVENEINIFTEWIIDVFKIQRLESLKIKDNNFKINKIEFVIFVAAKLLPFMFLFMKVGNNTYYDLYEKNEEKYCIENNEVILNREKYGLIMLKNGNVFQMQPIFDKNMDVVELRYFEHKCKTPTITIWQLTK